MGEVIITDLTRMRGNHICLAGYRIEGDRFGDCIRPEWQYEPLPENWLYSAEGVIRPFSIVDFDLISHRPAPPHTEDWIVGRRYHVSNDFALDRAEEVLLWSYDASIQDLYGGRVVNDEGWYVPANTGVGSLGTIRLRSLDDVVFRQREDYGTWNFRLRFRDESDDSYSLSVTDLCFRYMLERLRDQYHYRPEAAAEYVRRKIAGSDVVYLRIGLSRPYGSTRERCFLQINGVHTFPDYLNGKCHADYAPEEPDRSPVQVPF
jgi:hypothetical protein